MRRKEVKFSRYVEFATNSVSGQRWVMRTELRSSSHAPCLVLR